MKKLVFIFAVLGLVFTSCEKENIQPNQQAQPAPNGGGNTNNGNATSNFIFEGYMTSAAGYNLHNEIDSIVFNNYTTGVTHTWYGADTINWLTNSCGGQYGKVCIVPLENTDLYTDSLNISVWFNTTSNKYCVARFGEDNPCFNSGTPTTTFYSYDYY